MLWCPCRNVASSSVVWPVSMSKSPTWLAVRGNGMFAYQKYHSKQDPDGKKQAGIKEEGITGKLSRGKIGNDSSEPKGLRCEDKQHDQFPIILVISSYHTNCGAKNSDIRGCSSEMRGPNEISTINAGKSILNAIGNGCEKKRRNDRHWLGAASLRG